ncbi:MAG: tRNA dihydrouridine synthase DusB [Deltaproteobacteria bacterium]|nr:tRNA dihydrouridine synthase DusB [Deltaproteobacteria bacterium]
MRIGPYEITQGAFLAPMAGVTNPAFRQLCREMGAALSSTELVSCHALVYVARKQSHRQRKLGQKTLALVERYPGESPFAVQIFGRDPDVMAEAAKVAQGEGAEILDLNFGCPARKVVKDGRGAGAALMLDPALLVRVAAAVVAAVNVPVTAKIRLGWSPATRNAPLVAHMLEGAGVQALCVHARTRDQIHSGPVDLDTLTEVRASVSIPVVGNGGIRSRADAVAMMTHTGCERVAVGQAARGNPWIFGEILGVAVEPDLAARVRVCRRHLALFAAEAGESRAALEMRKHACWYLKGFPGAASFRKKLGTAVDVVTFERLLDDVLAEGDL